MSGKPVNILSPVGRMIGGDLYDPKTTNYEGDPLVYKSGANIGKPRADFSFGVAFPKTPGAQAWWQEQWMMPVMAVAQQAFPQGEYQRDDFSWKITDGDSQKMDKKNKRWCDKEGYPGHWVIWFGGAVQPRLVDKTGHQALVEKGAIRSGYYVQVYFDVSDNKPGKTPGLYMNHRIVSLQGYGPEIVNGPDPSTVGFGTAALPAGASATPIGGMQAPMMPGSPGVPAMGMPGMPAAGAQPAMGMPGAPAAPLIPNLAPAGFAQPGQPHAAIAPVAQPLNVSPNTAILNVPGQVPSVGVPGLPVGATPARQMTAKAAGYTYEQFIASGQWNDAMLIQHGYMTP